jgi:hypothetical protein
LHEVVDRWWVDGVLPWLCGKALLVRYADDLVMVFSDEAEARRVAAALPGRMAEYGLTLHPEKTRLIRYQPPTRGGDDPGTFDFLGFTHYWAKSRRGRWVPKRKTAKGRFSRALRALNEWMRRARHKPIEEQSRILGAKLRGHFNYYGVRGNSAALSRLLWFARRFWKKWLSRRSQRREAMTWEKFARLEHRYPLPHARLRPDVRQLRLANL